MNRCKRWTIATVLIIVAFLVLMCVATIVIDPFFHYHAPLTELEYPMEEERYMNDGILRNFEYDAMITGTSMTENFKTSELDALFGTTSVKVPFAGANYHEINENIERALERNENVKLVVRGLDYKMLLDDADSYAYDSYPTYLYDDNLWNDVYYWFNKDIWLNDTLEVISYTRSGEKTPDFDTYANWTDDGWVFGKEGIETYYTRPEICEETFLTNAERECLLENIERNVTETAKNNPEVTFYYFFTPYSIYYWDELERLGILEKQLEIEKIAIEKILECDNIKLFSFFDNFDMICNPDNYRDSTHYSEEINSEILQWMYQGEYRLTTDNYLAYLDCISGFYESYDYDSLFEDETDDGK